MPHPGRIHTMEHAINLFGCLFEKISSADQLASYSTKSASLLTVEHSINLPVLTLATVPL